jgi:hypothetical protein
MVSPKLATGLSLILLSLGHHDAGVQAQTQTSSVTDGQIQACRAAMIAVDVDLDGRVNRAEYVNLVSAISGPPFFSADCDDFAGDISNFLGSATFSTLFQELACKCLERAPPFLFGVIFLLPLLFTIPTAVREIISISRCRVLVRVAPPTL